MIGYEKPTVIQEKAIPQIISSTDDLKAFAQTGTGKTAAFSLPILQLADEHSKNTQAIILSPTRELAVQIGNNIKEFAKYMRAFIATNSSEDCEIEITGMPFVDITMDQSLINSQIGSILIAILFVIILVGIILRSWISGLYASIPIIATIMLLFGFMGLTGISLNIATVLVASVALGIGIDYSIHIISHFNESYKKSQDLYASIQESILISGNAIIINVISVSAGFLILVFSEMVPLQYFGLLIALSMVSSCLGALTLLPSILILMNRNKSKNNMQNES